MYYDMLTRVDILAATVKFDLKKYSIYVYASVNLYPFYNLTVNKFEVDFYIIMELLLISSSMEKQVAEESLLLLLELLLI